MSFRLFGVLVLVFLLVGCSGIYPRTEDLNEVKCFYDKVCYEYNETGFFVDTTVAVRITCRSTESNFFRMYCEENY